MLVGGGIVEGGFDRKLVIFEGLDMPGYGLVPIDDSFFFVAEPLDFFLVFVAK